jgi:antitoxin (DNA-binding transcriptional repressor) of toxin-antitoxin stability system
MPGLVIDVNDLPARFAEAFDVVQAGEDVFVVAAGYPPMRLTLAGLRPIILGMHPGAMEMAPDFDDPLPDEFWLGDPATDPLQNPDAFSSKHTRKST